MDIPAMQIFSQHGDADSDFSNCDHIGWGKSPNGWTDDHLTQDGQPKKISLVHGINVDRGNISGR